MELSDHPVAHQERPATWMPFIAASFAICQMLFLCQSFVPCGQVGLLDSFEALHNVGSKEYASEVANQNLVNLSVGHKHRRQFS